MSVGIAIVGRDVLMTLGGDVVIGTNNKGISFTNEMADVTDDQSSGWMEFAASPLLKSAELSISGFFKNLELFNAFFGASNIFAVTVTYPEGSVLTFDAAMTGAPSVTHESNAASTFEASFTSSGVVVFVAGT